MDMGTVIDMSMDTVMEMDMGMDKHTEKLDMSMDKISTIKMETDMDTEADMVMDMDTDMNMDDRTCTKRNLFLKRSGRPIQHIMGGGGIFTTYTPRGRSFIVPWGGEYKVNNMITIRSDNGSYNAKAITIRAIMDLMIPQQ
jgi:hypothetical protein